LADQPAYTADMYRSLEEFFLRKGYRGDADRAFIAGKRRERKERLHGLDWLGSYLLDRLVGYGRRPWQAGIPCSVLVALGCVLFSPKKWNCKNRKTRRGVTVAKKWNRENRRTRPGFTVASGIASACFFPSWTSKRLKCGSPKTIRHS